MQKVTPLLWFNGQAEEVAKFYTTVFKNSKILHTSHYLESAAKASGQPVGSVMTVEFEIQGQKFIAYNGGQQHAFTPAISFVMYCDTQFEIDSLWDILNANPNESQSGWLKDKYGISWQIVPAILPELLSDPAKAPYVMRALMQMKKIDIETLKRI